MKLFASLLLAALVCNSGAAYAQSGTPVGFTSWTTSTRPKLPYAGQLGYNQNLQVWEWWSPALRGWFNPSTVPVTGDISNATFYPQGSGTQQFLGQFLGSALTKDSDISNNNVIVNGQEFKVGDFLAAGAVGGGPAAGNVGSSLTEYDSATKAPQAQVCAHSCDLYRAIINIAGTAGATAGGYIMLFDTVNTACPSNGPLTAPFIPKPALPIDTDGTRGTVVLKYDNGQQRHYQFGLLICFSTTLDPLTITLGGNVMTINAGVNQ